MNPLGGVSHFVDRLSVLLVAPRIQDILFAVRPLSNSRFDLTVAETFSQARAILNVRPPGLLITEIRLGEFNGLHLVLRGRGARPDMAAIVTSTSADNVLQSEAEQLGATFVLMPTSEAELMAAVERTLFRTDASVPIRAPFERRTHERRAHTSVVNGQLNRRKQERRRNFSPPSQPAAASG